MLVADKPKMEKAGTAKMIAAEGLVRYWWYSVAVLPLVPFVLKGEPAGIFKGRDSMEDGDIPQLGWTTGNVWYDRYQEVFSNTPCMKTILWEMIETKLFSPKELFTNKFLSL